MRVPATMSEVIPAAVPVRRAGLRRAWVKIHLWLGLTLGVVGAVVGITGSVLVFDRAIDGALNPQRYATSGKEVELPYADYVRRATSAAGDGARAVNLRLPQSEAMPVVVFVREGGASAGLRRVYLDPPTGRVLDAPAGGGLIGWAHDFHESLTLREYSGREIVGCVGIAMLISSLSGIYLWWPRRSLRRNDFTFRRGSVTSRKLHITFGIYASLVLAMLSFTGIFLAFPERPCGGRRTGPGHPGAGLLAPNRAADHARRSRRRRSRAISRSQRRRRRHTGAPRGVPDAPRRRDDPERGGIVVFVDPRSSALRAARSGGADERGCVSCLPAPAARRRRAGDRRTRRHQHRGLAPRAFRGDRNHDVAAFAPIQTAAPRLTCCGLRA
jgi:hypothetical protein